MPIGTVRWFDNGKGYGFIDTGSDKDIFVHYSAIRQDGYRTLAVGQEVEYEVGECPKGLQAENVIPLQIEAETPVSVV